MRFKICKSIRTFDFVNSILCTFDFSKRRLRMKESLVSSTPLKIDNCYLCGQKNGNMP